MNKWYNGLGAWTVSIFAGVLAVNWLTNTPYNIWQFLVFGGMIFIAFGVDKDYRS